MNPPRRIAYSALALALGLALAGCGDKPEQGATVAAKVNAADISVSQVEHEVAKLGKLSPAQQKQAANQVLKSMVDQQLLLQKAQETKLDSDPKVALALESARRQILVQAYVQKLAENLPKPSDQEIDDYYAKHPELFAERRVYRLQEIQVQAKPENAEAIKAQLAQNHNLNDFVQWLRDRNIPARIGQSAKAAEQLPLEILPKLHQMKEGQAMTLAGPGSLNILIVAGVQSQPLDQAQARPMIERFIGNARKREAAEAELKKLRETAKIEYLGEFSEAGQAPAQPALQNAPDTPLPLTGDHAEDKGPALR